ncbi:MAG: hypothetical protein RL095_28 [Verrucomicrobiota bacterium]|jgi:hypothetical protein
MSDENLSPRISVLSDEELHLIEEDYRRRKLKENLLGPTVSTVAHMALLVCAAIFLKGAVTQAAPRMTVVSQVEKKPETPPPPPPQLKEIPIPEPEESNFTEASTVALNDPAKDRALESTDDANPSTDDMASNEMVSIVKNNLSLLVSSHEFGGRTKSGRASMVAKYGDPKGPRPEIITDKALAWLAKVQKPDGSWGTAAEDGYTGLALLCFLANGETPTAKNYGKTVERAIQYLAQSRSDDHADKHLYSHAIKTYALCEAYAMTSNYNLEEVMNANVRRIIQGQQAGGGFDYNYRKGERDDLSIAGWNFQALKAAKSAQCIEPGLDAAIAKSVENLKQRALGGFTYCNNEGRKNEAMRAVGTLCLQLFEEAWDDQGKPMAALQPIVKTIAEEDIKKLDWNAPPQNSMYSWYYGTYVAFQEGGPLWKSWQKKFLPMLKTHQNPAGYWDYPGHQFGAQIGDELTQKVHATTMAVLMLSVYYRFLPSTKGQDKRVAQARAEAVKAPARNKDESVNL